MQLHLYVSFVATDNHYEEAKHNALMQIKYALYDDIIPDIYEVLSLCEDPRVRSVLYRILQKIKE